MTLPNVQSSFCSSRSRVVDEPLYGTARHAGVYIIIEWNEKFPNEAIKAFVGQVFQGELQEKWRALLDRLPMPQVQLIRQRGFSIDEDGLSVFIAVPKEHSPLLYEFRLNSYKEILDLDIVAMVNGDEAYTDHLKESPLYLVCTNGSHDPCCARHGLPVYKSMSLYLGTPDVWQTSHIGGHRFAGTGILFPHGIFYGRLTAENSPEVIDMYENGTLSLDHYRGRVCYSRVEQAAEYHVRRKSGMTQLHMLSLLDTETVNEDRWIMRFETRNKQTTHRIEIQRELSTWANPMSCSKEEAESVAVYKVLDYSVNGA